MLFRSEEADLPSRGRFELVAVQIPVTEVSAQDMATELQPLMTKLGKIVPVASANRMVVSDLRERLQQVLKLIHTGDIETASIRSEVITLKNTNADDVVKSLQQMMGNAVAVASGGSGGAARTASAASGPPVVSVVETNCIIIRGREQSLRKIRELVADLDRLPAQVHIQAMLVEVELSDTDEFGVELSPLTNRITQSTSAYTRYTERITRMLEMSGDGAAADLKTAASLVADGVRADQQIGRASCRERV